MLSTELRVIYRKNKYRNYIQVFDKYRNYIQEPVYISCILNNYDNKDKLDSWEYIKLKLAKLLCIYGIKIPEQHYNL